MFKLRALVGGKRRKRIVLRRPATQRPKNLSQMTRAHLWGTSQPQNLLCLPRPPSHYQARLKNRLNLGVAYSKVCSALRPKAETSQIMALSRWQMRVATQTGISKVHKQAAVGPRIKKRSVARILAICRTLMTNLSSYSQSCNSLISTGCSR